MYSNLPFFTIVWFNKNKSWLDIFGKRHFATSSGFYLLNDNLLNCGKILTNPKNYPTLDGVVISLNEVCFYEKSSKIFRDYFFIRNFQNYYAVYDMDNITNDQKEYLFCEQFKENQEILAQMDKEYLEKEALEEVLSL